MAGELPDADDPGAQPGDPPVEGDPRGSNAQRECDVPGSGWIFCDDFAEDRGDLYFDHNDGGGAFVRAGGVGLEGSSGMRIRWEQGDVSVGALQVMIGRNPASSRVSGDSSRDYREIYWRMYVRHQPGFVGGGADKLSRATILATSDWKQAMIGHVWSGRGSDVNRLVVDPASGTDEQGHLRTTGYNDFENLRWMGVTPGQKQLFGSSQVGDWYCVEAHVRLNDADRSNGRFTLWVDGAREAERTDLNWVGSYSDYGLNAVFFENYWNSGSPAAQERYFDNIVISTERIGCVEDGSA